MTPSNAKTDPIDRSIPPVMITRPSPSEKIPNRPIRLAVLARLTGDRKRGLISATTAPTTRIRMRRPRSFLNMAVPNSWSADSKLHHVMLAELIALKFAADPAFMHDQDTIAHPDNLLHVAGNHQHSDASIGKSPYEAVDFALGADVNPTRRLIE